jgi:hypothetical protein
MTDLLVLARDNAHSDLAALDLMVAKQMLDLLLEKIAETHVLQLCARNETRYC